MGLSAETLALIALSAAKFLTYVGAFGLTGAAAMWFVVFPGARREGDPPNSGLSRLFRRVYCVAAVSAGLLVMGAAARLGAQTYAAFGVEEPVTIELLSLVAFETRWGQGWLPQLAAAIVAGAAVLLTLLRPRLGWGMTAAAAILVAVTLPMTGHALAHAGGAAFPWVMQSVHVAAAALWLGSLAALLLVVGPVLRTAAPVWPLGSFIARFSPLAVASVAAVMATGVATAVVYLDHWSDLWQSSYGRFLVAKAVLMSATGAVGAYNWRVLTPRLGLARTDAMLLRSGRAELLLGGIVLLVAAILVHLPMPGG